MEHAGARIARNTIALYFRTTITVIVSLYTSRIVLDQLGASDFGLYNLVGGFVVMMGFVNAGMISATQRFLSFEKNAPDITRVNRVFGTSLYIHILIAACIFLFAETIGLWFLKTQLNIEAGRMDAAFWVYQAAVASFLISMLASPFTAAIIANERMTAFAYTGLLDAILKLLAAWLLLVVADDKLQIYAMLTLATSATLAAVYALYARRNFPECRSSPHREPAVYRQMFSFLSWSVVSNLSVVLRTQGTNVMLNLFFGTLVNAAMSIAFLVSHAIQSFSSNFIQALNPQIVKTYAVNDLDAMRVLLMFGCRLSFFLVFLFSLPALIETEAIIGLWLKTVPEHTTMFVRLILIQSLVESFAGVMGTAQGATGNIKRYHITLSAIGLFNLPVSYLFLKAGFEAHIVLVVAVFFSGAIGAARVLFLRKSITLPIGIFLRHVVARCALVTALALAAPLSMSAIMHESFLNSVIICAASGTSVVVAMALVGVSGQERRAILDFTIRQFRPTR